MRALDVGTWDGFWAFEMERRGAEVVALDLDDEATLDWPPRRRPATFPTEPRGAGFRLAHELLGSSVERVVLSASTTRRRRSSGRSTSSSAASVLIHLRDQLLALERIAGLCTRHASSRPRSTTAPRACCPSRSSRYLADRDAGGRLLAAEPARLAADDLDAGFDAVERARARSRCRRARAGRCATSSTTPGAA